MEVNGAVGPDPDIVAEARRILDHAAESSVPVRLVGGVAIHLHAAAPPPQALSREFKDIDLVTERKAAKDVLSLLERIGYEPNQAFNAMNAGRRALFYDLGNERQLDVFIGSFEMCHELPIADRLHLDTDTIPLAELMLTKLQIFALNEKDLLDIYRILIDHDVDDHDSEAVNGEYIAELCAADWGLWRTTTLNIERARSGVGEVELDPNQRQVLSERLEVLTARIEAKPKSRRWRMRDRVGDRVRWYQEPEEVDGE